MAVAEQKPSLALKKLGGILLLPFALLLLGLGFYYRSNETIVAGLLVLVAAIALLALKIMRRNQPG